MSDLYNPKFIKKLADKKHREESGLFLVEGEKNIEELLTSSLVIEEIHGTSTFLDKTEPSIRTYEARMKHPIRLNDVREDELVRMGTLMTNNAGIAIVRQSVPAELEVVLACAKEDIVLLLDDIRDPGNLGTILRIADWYGVKYIVASPNTTDCYNPKVISASMGSFTRVPVTYTNLHDLMHNNDETKLPVMGAVFDGENTHKGKFPHNGFLIMGSESHGITNELSQYISHKLTIPRFGSAESLNVGVATAVLLDTLRRQQ